MFRLIVLLLAFCAISGAATLFEDYFDGGSAVGWTEYSNYPDSANYYVADGWYHMEIEYLNAGIYSANGDDATTTPHVMSVPDYSFYCKTLTCSPTNHTGLGVRMDDPIGIAHGYVLWLRYNSQDAVLFRHDGPGTNFEILDTEPFALTYDQEYWIKLTVEGSVLQGKVWQGSLGDEPSLYTLEADDATYGAPGSILLGCQSWGTISNHAAFDSVIVIGPLALESDTWGAIKASF